MQAEEEAHHHCRKRKLSYEAAWARLGLAENACKVQRLPRTTSASVPFSCERIEVLTAQNLRD